MMTINAPTQRIPVECATHSLHLVEDCAECEAYAQAILSNLWWPGSVMTPMPLQVGLAEIFVCRDRRLPALGKVPLPCRGHYPDFSDACECCGNYIWNLLANAYLEGALYTPPSDEVVRVEEFIHRNLHLPPPVEAGDPRF